MASGFPVTCSSTAPQKQFPVCFISLFSLAESIRSVSSTAPPSLRGPHPCYCRRRAPAPPLRSAGGHDSHRAHAEPGLSTSISTSGDVTRESAPLSTVFNAARVRPDTRHVQAATRTVTRTAAVVRERDATAHMRVHPPRINSAGFSREPDAAWQIHRSVPADPDIPSSVAQNSPASAGCAVRAAP